jgi:hypothetical protein
LELTEKPIIPIHEFVGDGKREGKTHTPELALCGLSSHESRILKSKWKKVGVCRISSSKKVVLLAIFELESYRWLVIDAGDLLELLAGHRFDVPIKERDLSV